MNPFRAVLDLVSPLPVYRSVPQEPSGMEAKVRIDWLTNQDLSGIVKLEYESYSNPRTLDRLVRDLRSGDAGYVASCACGCGSLLGYMTYCIHKHFYEITGLAVQRQIRRQGVGAALVDRLKASLGKHGRMRLRADVHETNIGAQLFLRSCGFRAAIIVQDREIEGDMYRFVHRKQMTEHSI